MVQIFSNMNMMDLINVVTIGACLHVGKAFWVWQQTFASREKRVGKYPNPLLPKDMMRTTCHNDDAEQKVMAARESTKPLKKSAFDIDFQYLDFFDFLWGYTFIRPNLISLIFKKMSILVFRKFLASRNIIKVAECDHKILAAKLCLEQMLVIHYTSMSVIGYALVATFEFKNFPYVNNDFEHQCADLFTIDINLDTKRFVCAKLDGENITAKETSAFLTFYIAGAFHPKLHAAANWSCNIDKSNPMLHRNSVATIMFNNFGFSGFPLALNKMARCGVVSKGWKDKTLFVKMFEHGLKEKIVCHVQIQDLYKYSRLVKFVVHARGIFPSQFEKHKNGFPNVDGEALFMGTVLHSLDHFKLNCNIEDPLWLDIDDSRTGKMAEVGRVSLAGFVHDLPGLYFERYFKDSGHPFFETVHRKLAKIDTELADNLDVCVIR